MLRVLEAVPVAMGMGMWCQVCTLTPSLKSDVVFMPFWLRTLRAARPHARHAPAAPGPWLLGGRGCSESELAAAAWRPGGTVK